MTVMFLILLGLFLTFAALALDLGNFYLWNLRLDKAARAGALAGLGARGLQGWTAVRGDPSIIENAARAAVYDSLRSYGFRDVGGGYLDGPAMSPDYNIAFDQLTVTVSYDIPTLLVGRISSALGWGFNEGTDAGGRPTGGPDKIYLASRQTAQLSRANVVLLLDVSGSMLCPVQDPPEFAGQPPCACRRSGLPNACGNQPTKLDQMALGVWNFVQQFNPSRDRISVIPFNLTARRLFSFFDYDAGGTNDTTFATLDAQQLQVAIQDSSNNEVVAANTLQTIMLNDLTMLTAGLRALAGSNTNHCDALVEAIRDLETLSADVLNSPLAAENDRRKLQPFVVFFTDGAPNAMRGIFPNASTSPNGDFYHYALEWVVPNPNPALPPFTYRGPGPFVLRSPDATNPVQPLFRFPIASGAVAPAGSPVCGTPQANFWQFEQTVTQNVSGGPGGRGAPGGCLTTSTFDFDIPFTNVDAQGNLTGTTYQAGVRNVPISTANTTWRDPNWPIAGPVPNYGLQKYDELPYYCAIEAADYLRLHFGATIFAIGLGPTNAHSITGQPNHIQCNDPLMDADDHSGRKDFFLSRLAFSRQAFTDQLVPVNFLNHYQINVPPNAAAPNPRQVATCANHRYRPGVAAVLPPQLTIGYNSTARNHASQASPGAIKSDNLTDVFKMLRPFHPVSTDPFNRGANGPNYRRIDTMGEYFPTNNPNEVPAIFSNIAKTILLRSTS